MSPVVSRCIKARQWQHVAAMEGRSVDAVRCQYDPTYLRADPVEAVKAIEATQAVSRTEAARLSRRARNLASRAARLEQMTDAERNFAHWLNQLRQTAQLHNGQLARITGWSATTISEICNLKLFPSAGIQAKINAGYARYMAQAEAA